MNENKACSICLETYIDTEISYCINCNESGNTCHNCELLWVKQRNNPKVCTICKQETKQNISENASNEYARNLFYLMGNQIIDETRSQIIIRRIEERTNNRLRRMHQNQREMKCIIFIISTFLLFIIFIGFIINVVLTIEEKNKIESR